VATPTATASPPATSTSSGPGWWLFLTGLVAGLLHRSPEPTPAAGTPAPAATSTSISPWWWLLVAAIVVALLVGGVLLWRRRRRRTTWSDEMGRVTTELRWADEQLIPSMLAAHTVAEFARTWSSGRPRLVAADQELYGLARRAPDEARAASIAELREAIAGVMSSVDAEAALTSMAPDELRAARADVERARSRFSAALDAAEGKPTPVSPEPIKPA
jgi:LPXTG-motif cell wall-anchored protein